MPLYFISYDKRGTYDYEELYEELSKYNAVAVLESTWCFEISGTTCTALRDHFKQFLDSDDGLLITESSSWASSKTNGTPKDL